ncbi:MAG: hypothetical protein IPJ41_15725 [Phycisphaerales bacterium]|nr:hypothetical protein [Phycisphaerales bacterium]
MEEKTQIAILGFQRQCLGFILAHEVGHVMLEHDPAKQAGESPDQYLSRLRDQELRADQFAIDLMLTHRELPVGPAQLFFAWVLVKDRTPSVSAKLGHPADHKRAMLLCDYVLSNVDKYDLLGVDRSLVVQSFTSLQEFCATVDADPNGVIEDMERVGASIKPENLRLDRWKP